VRRTKIVYANRKGGQAGRRAFLAGDQRWAVRPNKWLNQPELERLGCFQASNWAAVCCRRVGRGSICQSSRQLRSGASGSGLIFIRFG
jgi:hypothetical protein